MPTDPEPKPPESKPPASKRPRGKPRNDGFVVFEVDGYAQLTAEQKLWPVVSFWPDHPKPAEPLKPPPEAEGGTEPPAAKE